MKLKIFTAAVLASICFSATADPICVTLNNPGKWGAGLVLRIVDNSDGTQTAFLQSAQMFRAATSTPTSEWNIMLAITPVTRTQSGNRVTYVGGSGTRTLNATITSPDQNGNVDGTVSIQQEGLSISATGVSMTRFSGDAKCQ